MFTKKEDSIRKKQLKNLKWLKEKTDEKSWWVVVRDLGTRETMGFNLKGKHTIKEAVNDILDDHSDRAEIEHLVPYSLAHTCPVCNTLVENENIFELCEECKATVMEKRDVINRTEEEVMADAEKRREEAMSYLKELQERLSKTEENNSKLN